MRAQTFCPEAELEPGAIGGASLKDMVNASMAISLKRTADATVGRPPIAVDLRDWSGLDLTDSHDNAGIVQSALNQAAASGQKLYVPPGLIALDSTIIWPVTSQIFGAGQASSTASAAYSWFHLAHTGVGFSAVAGQFDSRSMRGVNFYRSQPTPAAGWTPLSAGADIAISGAVDITITDCLFLNPTVMIGVGGDPVAGKGSGRIILRNIKGQPLTAGIVMTQVYDVCYMDEIHLWPFWSQDPNVVNYVRGNAYAFILNRVDNPKLGRIFTWGYWRGLVIGEQADVGNAGLPPGTTSLLHADVVGVDNCGIGFLVNAGDSASAHINQLYAVSGSGAEPAILVQGTNANITIGDLYGANGAGLVSLAASGNTMTIGTSRSVAVTGTEFNVATGNTLRLMSPPQTSAPTVYAGTITGATWAPLVNAV